MAINHGINADDNNLNEILQTKQAAGQMIVEAEALEREILGIENDPRTAAQASGLAGRAEASGSSLSGGVGSNRAEVYGDMALNKLTGGMASVEMASMGLKILTADMGVFKSVKDGFKGKKKGYGTASKSIDTGAMTGKDKKNLLAFRAAAVSGFNSDSGTKGVSAAKGSAPDLKAEKAMVYAKKMEHAQTHGMALQAEAAKHAQIHKVQQLGGPTAGLYAGPKINADTLLAEVKKQQETNIWGGDSKTT